MRLLTAVIESSLLLISLSTSAYSQSKPTTIEQLANELSEAYVGKGLGSLETAHPYFGKVRIVTEHSAADDNDPQRFEIKTFKTLAQGERWLKSRERTAPPSAATGNCGSVRRVSVFTMSWPESTTAIFTSTESAMAIEMGVSTSRRSIYWMVIEGSVLN